MPNLFLLLGVLLLVLLRPVYTMPAPFEKFVMFPMAVVPNLWGVWNTLFVAMTLKRWIPMGAWGAFLPLIILAGGLGLAYALDNPVFGIKDALFVLPVAVPAYYLIWKYAVRFFNRVVGLD